MKTKVYFVGIVLLFFIIVVGILFIIKHVPNDSNIIDGVYEQTVELDYEDDNPLTISLYYNNGHVRQRIKEIYRDNWNEDVELISLGTFYTDVDNIPKALFRTNWLTYYNKYDKAGNFKIGYEVDIELSTGENIKRTILRPSDLEGLYGYVQIYLYDDIHQLPNSWYSHVEDNQFTDTTILSSVKLVASSNSDLVVSPLKFTAFTYNGMDDFDENGYYRGDSSYTVYIYKR